MSVSKVDRENAFIARNAELSAIAQYSEAHDGAYLVYWKKHYPLAYKLTGRFAIVEGTINLECQRNTTGATFFKASAGSKYFFGSLVMGETVTVYREGAPVQSDAEYIAKIRAIVNTQRSVKGITVMHAPVVKPVVTAAPATTTIAPATTTIAPATTTIAPAPVVTIAKVPAKGTIALTVMTEIQALAGTLAKIGVTKDMPIVKEFVAIKAQASVMKAPALKAQIRALKAKYSLA